MQLSVSKFEADFVGIRYRANIFLRISIYSEMRNIVCVNIFLVTLYYLKEIFSLHMSNI